LSKKEENDKVEIDFGTGRISFGGLFKGLGNLVDLAAKLREEGVEKSGEIRGLPRGTRGVYGFSIRTLAGKPVIESFGNIRETAKGPVVEEVRENEIKVDVAGDILNLTAADKDRKYAREILLPGKVKPESVKTSYNNGILEITLEKEK
jgi:HSP20 family protein